MGLSRHSFKKTIIRNGKQILSTNRCSSRIYGGVINGVIICDPYILKEGERLDIIAQRIYKNSEYWWIIAAASGIGWNLQVPPGTIIAIPRDLNQVFAYTG
jgi:hypothetical protein